MRRTCETLAIARNARAAFDRVLDFGVSQIEVVLPGHSVVDNLPGSEDRLAASLKVPALAFGDSTPRPASPSGLSGRELEVAGLVAYGLANKAIAQRLHLSVRTVESHVRHALTKLGLDNRTQLATWARGRIQ